MGLRDHQFSPLPVRSAFVSLICWTQDALVLVWMLAVSASHKDAEVSSGLCHKAQPGPGRSGGFVSYSIYLFSCEEKQVSATVGITEMTWFCRCLDLGFLFVPRYWNVILTQDFSWFGQETALCFMHLASCVLAFLFLSNWKAYELLQGLLETKCLLPLSPPRSTPSPQTSIFFLLSVAEICKYYCSTWESSSLVVSSFFSSWNISGVTHLWYDASCLVMLSPRVFSHAWWKSLRRRTVLKRQNQIVWINSGDVCWEIAVLAVYCRPRRSKEPFLLCARYIILAFAKGFFFSFSFLVILSTNNSKDEAGCINFLLQVSEGKTSKEPRPYKKEKSHDGASDEKSCFNSTWECLKIYFHL